MIHFSYLRIKQIYGNYENPDFCPSNEKISDFPDATCMTDYFTNYDVISFLIQKEKDQVVASRNWACNFISNLPKLSHLREKS
jgi:hypothetical protein